MKHPPGVDPEDLETAAEALGVPLSAAQVEGLVSFEELLRGRAVPLGLVAQADASRIRTRHMLDCLRAARVVGPGDRDAYDLGSGAGLPGVIVAIARPDLSMVLVESKRRAAAFLELVVEELGVSNARVATARVEALEGPVDLCFARALASLERCWNMSRPLLGPGGRLVYFAGKGAPDPQPLAGASSAAVMRTPVLASSGPLVIMARQ